MIAHAAGPILDATGQPALQASGYDALEPRNRRRSVITKMHSEDLILPTRKRDQLASTTLDLRRNYELVAWAIRRHLDYVTSFNWQATTDDQALNRELEEWFEDVTTAARFDAAGRHNLARFRRIAEAERVVRGDFWTLKQNDGSVMGIEADRVSDRISGKMPGSFKSEDFVNGVQTDRRGRLLRLMIGERDKGKLINPRILPARFFWLLAYIDRIDQVRGVSPLACALNRFRDTYEGLDYALARSKVEQLFALVLTRNASEAMGDLTGGEDADGNEDKSGYSVDFGKGPQVLDLDPGDDAKFLAGSAPGNQFESYQKFSIMIALKALDIPYSLFDEKHTNFYGSRGALTQYVKSAEAKRADHVEINQSWLAWRMAVAIRDGELDIGRRTLREVRGEWRAVGVPWWDPSKEIDGHLKAIASGLDNPQRIAKTTTGTDYYENLELRKQAEDRAAELGLEVSWTASNQQAMRGGSDDDE